MYYWCEFHKQWTRHKPSECKRLPIKTREQRNASKSDYRQKKQANMEAKVTLQHFNISSESEEEETPQLFNGSDSDSNVSDSTEYFSEGEDSKISWLLVGYQRKCSNVTLLAHMPISIYHFITAKWHYVPTMIYIASCLCLNIVLYILNIHSRTRYSNPWITPRVYRTLQKYLRRWRFMMAHSNEWIDVYFKVRYKVSEYQLKTLYPRSTVIPGRKYKAIRRQRLRNARWACLQAIALRNKNQRPSMAMVTYSRYPHRVHFDTDSYEILVDNCCSKSITNCLEDFIAPPRSSNMIIKGFNGATATTKVGTVQWRLQDDWASTHYNIARDLLLWKCREQTPVTTTLGTGG